MGARRLDVLLLLLGVAATVALASEAPPLTGAAKSPAASAAAVVAAAETAVDLQVGDVQHTVQPDDSLDIAVLRKKAVKLGKCIYRKKLVDCTPATPSPPPPPA
jgi:hypothetical protein